MSKINAIRLINLNYNNNSIKISDDTFHLNGESTLLSLRNGGGKSVLVQMIMAPFVHKRYWDTKDRPFESYFTTAKPTFILVEWMLDQGAGYVLTGMMVRRSQNMDKDQWENLDMINLVSEYREPCLTDIQHLPVVEKGKKEMVLKSFSSCRQLFEEFKKDSSLQFFYYDMTNSAQSRQYFDKLMEYQINYKEWETIIKKVNLEESGLSNLFADCRDERGLVEKWFLEAVEGKLNKEKNRMKEFQTITEKYVGQYKDNQSKIKRRDTIRLFKEQGTRIEEKAEKYEEIEQKKQAQENRIAVFIKDLNALKDERLLNLGELKEQAEDILRQIEQVAYEKLSSEYYGIDTQKKLHVSNRDMLDMEQEELEREAHKKEELLCLLSCARQQELVTEEKAELDEIRQKLDVCQRKQEDLAPERDVLGYQLRCYYEQLLEDNATGQKKRKQDVEQTEADILGLKDKLLKLEQDIRENDVKRGALESRVLFYDSQEERFNQRYGEHFTRNILGSYEPGMLKIQEETYQNELDELVRKQTGRRKQMEDSKEQVRSLEHKLEEKKEERRERTGQLKQKEAQKELYEKELSVRAGILKYLDIPEEEQFDTDKIQKVSERKLQELADIRRNLEKEEDGLFKEYQKLTQGKVLELPKELEQELTDLGIHAVYGMEWLKKNGYSEKKNREIVGNHPFLPYALILSGKELEKLSQHVGDIYTSFPIPIIRREQLEEKIEGALEHGVVSFGQVSFYVLFNENLLNEEKLAALVAELQQQIERKKQAIAIRQQEYKEYFERKETIRNQQVTKKGYEETKEQLAELEQQIESLSGEVNKTSQQLSELKETRIRLETEIRKAEGEIGEKKRKIEDFNQLCQEYQDYEQNGKALQQCKKELERLKDKKELSSRELEKRNEELKRLEIEIDKLQQTQRNLQDCFRCYCEYDKKPEEPDWEELKQLSIADKEARFKAITASMSQELQDLEGQEQKALKRYEEAKKELERLRVKYKFEPGAWSDTDYSPKKVTHLETLLEDLQKKISRLKMLWNEENTKIAVLNSQMDGCMKQIQTDCGKEEPLPKSAISDRDFDAVKNQLLFQEKERKKKADRLSDLVQSCEENLTALAEYSEFPVKEPVHWEEELGKMSREHLRRQKGILIRDYKTMVEDRRDAKEQLIGALNQIVRLETFSEEFYQKPLEAMLELTEDASQVKKQLSTTIQSYDSLMEKLEVDISVVEKEKEKIVELMEDYVKEVHTNLGKIDANSTIMVRKRPLKMLKIQLPDWEENANVYHIRLLDFIDEITRKGIELFEQNENAQEYFGTQITTKNLYDTVIGIGDVQIKLYKIEEQREYPITWAEVAKNSGGEGFLSAFVILSSLLYYMRRDDTDFFADRNEGKVLVMDNPFAQTNASHLLKPLMDMAKKANTQLICLTGLGGESIYNRFDNIYVLNLIAASLRNGMQYLKVEHVKGNEPEMMVVSQIEVTEQMELDLF